MASRVSRVSVSKVSVSAAFGYLLPSVPIFLSVSDAPFSRSATLFPVLPKEPSSGNALIVFLPVKGFQVLRWVIVSLPAQLGVLMKENIIRLRAEGFENSFLHPSARISDRARDGKLDCARDGKLIPMKDISGFQAEGPKILDLLNGVIDLHLFQIYSHRSPKIRRQETDPMARSWCLRKTQIYGQAIIRGQCQMSSNLKQLSPLNKPDLHEESPAFQIQVNLSGKTTMIWVHAADLVQDLLQKLERRLGIPSSCIRLLFKGKQLMQPLSLSFYSIQKDASIGVSFRLRGGSFGQTSFAPPFSYKDAARKSVAHPQNSSSATQPNGVPKPFLVDKAEEIPSISLLNPKVENRYQILAESALICRFNGLWPRTVDLYHWVHSSWTKKCKIFLCSKGFFLVVFDSNEDYQKALTGGPWFWGMAGLFLTPWFPDFDPSTAVISKIPIWVRLPNLPAHFWDFSVFLAIGNTLGRYLATDTSRRDNGLYTYGRLCAETDISKGLPDQINLKFGDFHWTQSLDYENTAFRCRHCHQTGHLQSTCSQFKDKKKNQNRKPKSKRWNSFEPPRPLDDLYFSASEEEDSEADVQVDEEIDADMQNEDILRNAPSAVPEVPSNPQLSQKRSHLSSSSDSEKDAQPSEQNELQLVISQPSSNGWTKVSKKKGKKCRIVENNPSG